MIYLDLSQSISILIYPNLYLSWSIPIYIYLDLSKSILIYLDLSWYIIIVLIHTSSRSESSNFSLVVLDILEKFLFFLPQPRDAIASKKNIDRLSFFYALPFLLLMVFWFNGLLQCDVRDNAEIGRIALWMVGWAASHRGNIVIFKT